MALDARNRPVFSEAILPDGPSRKKALGAGFGLQCFLLALVLLIPILMPKRMQTLALNYIPISDPIVSVWKPKPIPKPVVKKVVVKELPKPVEKPVEAPKPKIYNPVIATPVVAKAVVKKAQAPDMTEVAKVFTPELGSSAVPNLRKPREEVQTGGFGDPKSVPDNHNTTHTPNMPALGAYDMPAGPGQGNGTGGAKGAKGVVTSAGFGNGVATGSGGSSSHGTVQQGLFGDERATGPQMRQTAAPVERYKAMELVFVPKPQYTAEARAKKVEGDVVIQVTFTATGEVKVVRVVQGLGYGLDEAAEAAARQIRFRPAEQNGQSVDTTANVRMKCQLAY
jgi:TonB family protein